MQLTFVVDINEPEDGFDMAQLNQIVDDLMRHLDSGDPIADIPKSELIANVNCTSVQSTD